MIEGENKGNTPTIEYNGWRGKGDTIASARFTFLTFLWLTNDQTIDEAASNIISEHADWGEAALALREFVEKKLFTNDPSQDRFADDLARDIFKHEVNWLEIVKQYVD